MLYKSLAAAALATLITVPALAHDYTVGALKIHDPWARATPKGAQVGGAYMTITNTGTTADRLIGGSTAVAKGFEVHEMSLANGVMKMRELPNGLEIKPGEIVTLPDYVRCSSRLREAIAPHVRAMLAAELSVVLDFQGNTPAIRAWMRTLFDGAPVRHQLHYLQVPDEVCKRRLRERNAAGTHAYRTTDAEYEQITAHFVPPSPAEGFEIVVHVPAG